MAETLRLGLCRWQWTVFPVLLAVLSQAALSFGGNCWLSMNRNGLCSSLVKKDASKEECCSVGSWANSVTVSWSDGDLSPSNVFFMHVQGGVPCTRCKTSCDNVQCPENQDCVLRNGVPKCVCSRTCSAFRENSLGSRGPVCGSDGRTYKSQCRLMKRACRRRISLSIAYHGPCQTSCSTLNCPPKKRCLLDQNMTPHCVNCAQRKCAAPKAALSNKSQCGVDGLTYPSTCHLRQAACDAGKAIPVAYRGPCKKKANCNSIKCSEGQTCLFDKTTQQPRCVTCSQPKWCRRVQKEEPIGPFCATDGNTYSNWCDMIQEACRTGYAIDTKHVGRCKGFGTFGNFSFMADPNINTVFHDGE